MDRLVQRLDAEVGFQHVRYPPGQHLPGKPVHDGDQKEEAATHRQVDVQEKRQRLGVFKVFLADKVSDAYLLLRSQDINTSNKEKNSKMIRFLKGCSAAVSLFASLSGASFATDLVVQVQGANADTGEIGCALYASAAGFPMEQTSVKVVWQPVKNGGAVCSFNGLAEGRYAVAVSHDLNGNRKTDTNFLGIPKEAWGVSNDVRPNLRAPTFDEAAFAVAGKGASISVTVAK